MPRFRFENRIKENSNDTGTGDFSLGGAQKTYRSFGDVCDDQDTFPYTIAHDAADEREVGIGKYDQSTDSIVRQTVLESSNNDSLVDFGAGTKVVAMTAPKERLPILDSAASNGDVPVFDGNEHVPQQSFPNQMRFDAGIDTRGPVLFGDTADGITKTPSVTIADDESETITPHVEFGTLRVTYVSGAGTNASSVALHANIDAINGDVAVFGRGKDTDVVKGSLGGTDGANGRFTVAVQSDGTIDFENRTGDSLELKISVHQ